MTGPHATAGVTYRRCREQPRPRETPERPAADAL